MLELQNVSFQKREKTMLKNISLHLTPGKVVGVIGANGAGKSTFIRLISGELFPTSGRIIWNSKDIASYTPECLARERSVLRQTTSLAHDFNTHEMVMMGRYPHFGSRPQLADTTIVEDEMDMNALTEKSFQPFRTLSGGEQQRVSLSRSFVQLKDIHQNRQVKCMMLDEPLNHLDIRYARETMSRVRNFSRQGHLSIVVLHDIQHAAAYCDEIIVLNDGALYAHGSPGEVFTNKMLFDCFHIDASIHRINKQIFLELITE